MSDQMNYRLHPTSGSVPITFVADFGLFDPSNAQFGRTSAAAAGELASLGGATAWLNSEPLTAADLRGKVVLVDFWTYTCINWLRTLPYVRAWAEKYRDQGLVVIGVHTTTQCGLASATTIGQRSIFSTLRGRFEIITSARATTCGRKS